MNSEQVLSKDNIIKKTSKISLVTLEGDLIEVVKKDTIDENKYKIIDKHCNWDRFLKDDRTRVVFIDEDYDYKNKCK